MKKALIGIEFQFMDRTFSFELIFTFQSQWFTGRIVSHNA